MSLTTQTAFEAPGTGYLRRTSKLLPAQVASVPPASTAGSTFSYYGDQEQLGSAICGVPATTPQSGFLRSSTGPTPAVGSAITTQYAYDLVGRAVRTKRSGDSDWSCTSFDARGRTTSTVSSAYAGTAARTTTSSYAVGGDPSKVSVSDPAGTITTLAGTLTVLDIGLFEPVLQRRFADPETVGDPLQRHSRLSTPSDRDNVFAKLTGIGLGQDDILPVSASQH